MKSMSFCVFRTKVGHVIAALTPTQQTKRLMTSCLSVKWQKNETLAEIAL